jgi:hypothetical protein
MCENPLRVQGGMRKRVVFIKPLDDSSELDDECY